mgnify:CR=1 FL=1
MADLIEDPKKKKASFGDAVAAATDPGITQLNVGKPGDFPVNPDGTPMQKMAAGALPPAALPPAAPAYVPGSLPKIGQEVPLAPGVQQGLANQTAMYVTGAQAANPQAATQSPTERPPAFSTSTLAAPSAPAQPQSDYARQMSELGGFLGAIPGAVAKWVTNAPGGGGVLASNTNAPAQATAPAQNPALNGVRMNEITDPRSLLYPGRQDPVQAAATTAPMADPASTPPAPAPIAAGAVKTQGQMNMEADLKSAEAMKAERLAAEGRAPQAVVTHSGNDWQARNNLRNLQVSASSMTASPQDIQAYNDAQKHDTSLQGGGTAADIANVAAANRNAEINSTAQVANARTAQQGQQFGASHELATQRLALDSRKADITDAGAQMDNATKKQIQDLNAAILKEPPGPKRDAMLEAHQTLTGKYQRPDPAARDVYGAIAGGTDAMGNKTDPIIYNKQTGQRAEAQGQATAPKVDEVRGGYKFKGGNPADQKNWEKV